jgi:hypothetical protein
MHGLWPWTSLVGPSEKELCLKEAEAIAGAKPIAWQRHAPEFYADPKFVARQERDPTVEVEPSKVAKLPAVLRQPLEGGGFASRVTSRSALGSLFDLSRMPAVDFKKSQLAIANLPVRGYSFDVDWVVDDGATLTLGLRTVVVCQGIRQFPRVQSIAVAVPRLNRKIAVRQCPFTGAGCPPGIP